MAKEYKINGCLGVGKGADIKYIGEGTEVTHLDKDAAKKYGINAKEFDKLVGSNVLTEGDKPVADVIESKEPQPASAAEFIDFGKAIDKLDAENEKHFDADGCPAIAALKELGVVVTKDKRDELWDLVLSV